MCHGVDHYYISYDIDVKNIKFRRALVTDTAALMRIRLSVTENAVSVERLNELHINERSLGQMMTTTHSGVVATDHNNVVGFGMVDRRKASIFALFVEPAYEGLGIGTRLLNNMMDLLRQQGNPHAVLTTEPGTRAFDFYVHHGWQKIGMESDGDAVLHYVF